MGSVVYGYRDLFCYSRLGLKKNSYIVSLSDAGCGLRRQGLEEVDNELSKGNEKAALSLVKDLHGKPDGLRCFGAARLIPQRLYSLDELKLNGIVTASLLSPVDATLGSIERNLQVAALLGGLAAWNTFELSPQQILFFSLGLLFLWTLDAVSSEKIIPSDFPWCLAKECRIMWTTDKHKSSALAFRSNHEVSFGGGISGLVLDTVGHIFSKKYHNRVIQHEAGHFLIAYLMGILPKGYTLTSLEALKKEGSLNVQAGTAFVDFEFIEEVNRGQLSATMLNKFSCIALAGVSTEYLLFGCAEGGLADINKLDTLLKSLGFTQKKADSLVRWAVLNTVLILRRHEKARAKLAEAMSEGSSVGNCIDTIEETVDVDDI